MSQNNRKRTVCVECRASLTRSTSGKCRDCLLKPAEAPREVLDASQQGAWTEDGKRRRAAELQRRRDQHKPLSLDAQAEIVAAVETDASLTVSVVDADVRKFRDQVLCADQLDVIPWEYQTALNREVWRKRYAKHLAERNSSPVEARLPTQTTSAPSEPAIVAPAPISKAEDWQARDVWSERVVIGAILAMMIGLGLACLLGRGAP